MSTQGVGLLIRSTCLPVCPLVGLEFAIASPRNWYGLQ